MKIFFAQKRESDENQLGIFRFSQKAFDNWSDEYYEWHKNYIVKYLMNPEKMEHKAHEIFLPS
jgi:hypothetical protein